MILQVQIRMVCNFYSRDTVERPILIISMVEDVKGRGGSGYVVKKDNLDSGRVV